MAVKPAERYAPVAKTRSTLFHVVAASLIISTMLACVAMQDHIKRLVAPVHEAIEGTTFAYVVAFCLLIKVPEMMPHWVVFTFLLLWSPPRELWRWWITTMVPRLAVPGIDESGQMLGYGIPSYVVFLAVYWGNGFLLLAIEKVICPQMVERVRIQTLRPHSRPPLSKICRNLACTSFLVLPGVTLAIGLFAPLRFSPELPGPWEMFCHAVASVVCNEVVFFYGHWLMHANKWLYKNVHKLHHENHAPMALAAIYCHPLEFIVSDIIPLAFGIVTLGGHAYTGLLWTAHAIGGTQAHHSGIHWPWLDTITTVQPHYHDYHHEKFNVNYGSIGWLDELHGTSWDWQREDTRFYRDRKDAQAAKAK